MLLLRCPKCRNKMLYNNMTSSLEGKRKSCVYCGKSFMVKTNLTRKA